MKPAILLAVAIVIVSSLPIVSRKNDAVAQENASANAGASARSGVTQASGAAASDAQMQQVSGELVSKLDSGTAKAGDPVLVKIEEKVRAAEGVEIPEGAWLVGRVASVQAHDAEHANANMSIVFDHAELKGGQSIPIHSVMPAGGASGPAPDTFSSTNRNVHLDSGTQVVLEVSSIASSK